MGPGQATGGFGAARIEVMLSGAVPGRRAWPGGRRRSPHVRAWLAVLAFGGIRRDMGQAAPNALPRVGRRWRAPMADVGMSPPPGDARGWRKPGRAGPPDDGAPVAPPPDPEDDESGRGVPRWGPALLVGVVFWAVVAVLLLL